MHRGITLVLGVLYQCVVLVEGLTADEMVKIGQPGRIGRPPPPRQRLSTLVIHDFEVKDKYSSFFSDLQGSRHDLTFVNPHEVPVLSVVENEVRIFDNVILFVLDPTESLYRNPALNEESISKFIDEYGGCLLTAGSSAAKTSTSRLVRGLANHFGVDFDSENSAVFDVSSNRSIDQLPLVTTNELVNSPLVWSQVSGGVAFSGMGMKIGEEARNYTFTVMSGEPTHYSAATQNSKPIATGSSISLVSAFQGLTRGRASFFGSFSMCSNEVFVLYPSNRLFCFQTALWTFQQAGVITWSDLQHREVGKAEASYLYRHSSHLEFEIDLWINANNGADWVPYRATDVQLEYTMLDPYIRQFLQPPTQTNSATYKLQFQAPDKTGIFKFVIQYFRKGLSNIHIETVAPLRHHNTNEQLRFVRNAFPYYSTCITQLVCFFVFVLYFTFHRLDKQEMTPDTNDDPVGDDSEATKHESLRKRKTQPAVRT